MSKNIPFPRIPLALTGVVLLVTSLLLVQCTSTTGPSNNVTATDAPPAGPAAQALASVTDSYAVDTFSEETCDQKIARRQLDICLVLKGVRPLEQEAWQLLLPNTYFFQVQTFRRSQDETLDNRHSFLLVAWHNNREYAPEEFNQLLAANGVDITDDNRELVAQAFALMTIPDYVGEPVVFSDWQVGPWDARHKYTHALSAWTRLEGVKVNWWFQFKDMQLILATRGAVSRTHTGDYRPADVEIVNTLSLHDYFFR